MSRYVPIHLDEFDELLKSSKGWKRNVSGKEYVYDYRMKNKPNIVIKILTSISENDIISRSAGKDAIRVFAVKVDNNGKVVKGICKSKRVYRTKNWKNNTVKAFMDIRQLVFSRV